MSGASVYLVVTTINKPNEVMKTLAAGSAKHGWHFVVIGDSKSPPDFSLENAEYLDLTTQQSTKYRFAKSCPVGHYTRKNIGYLVAMAAGANIIVETDDDNIPRDAFFERYERHQRAALVKDSGWVNVYKYFTSAPVWPRGLPLDNVLKEPPPLATLPVSFADCPVQQELADMDPDVDAIYRLVNGSVVQFSGKHLIGFGRNSWCPFNSQNTIWWKDAFPLLYLPGTCSIRLTDIWRGFITQRICWENDWYLLFREATVFQERNEHNLLRDFADEIPGYLP